MFTATHLSGFGGDGSLQAQAAYFDGSTDLSRGAALTGAADSRIVTASFWFNRKGYGETSRIFCLDNRRVDIFMLAGGELRFTATDSGGIDRLLVDSDTNFDGDSGWHHVLFSCDLNNSGLRHFYIDDVDETPTWTTYSGLTVIDWMATDAYVGTRYTGSAKWVGDLAEVWIDDGQYIDFSVEANRRDFIDSAGKRVDLGSDGSTPTGTAPLIFLSGEVPAWHTNKGGGGGFTENGTLLPAAGDPP